MTTIPLRRAGLMLALAVLSLVVAPSALLAQEAPLIVIDPGHGGPYSNANANRLKEKNVNLAIALDLRRQLIARGYRVQMTRTTDRAVSLGDISTWNLRGSNWSFARDWHRGIYNGIPKDDLQARVNAANRAGADLFISIHNNGAASRAARGTETFASPRDRTAIPLARLVHRRIVARTGLRDRRAKTADFYVCRWTNMPAILVEGAFITSPSDAWKLRRYTYRHRIALGIAEGVSAWFAQQPYGTVAAEISSTSTADAAIGLSSLTHSDGASITVVARQDLWPDSLPVPALTAQLGAPFLWIGPDGPTDATLAELARLAPSRLLLVGVEGSFDDTVTASLAQASGLTTPAVELVTASSREELAASIASMTISAETTRVVFADAADDSCAPVAAAAAASMRAPLLLFSAGSLPDSATELLTRHSETTITGVFFGKSTTTPSTNVPGIDRVVRITGTHVAAVAGTTNRWLYPSSARGSLSPVVADYGNIAGYLTASSYAAYVHSPLVPVRARMLPSASRLYITNRRPQIGTFRIFDAQGDIPALMGHMLRKADTE